MSGSEINERLNELQIQIQRLNENLAVLTQVLNDISSRVSNIENNGLGSKVRQIIQDGVAQKIKIYRLERERKNGFGI